jgi:hypothetical protein
VAVNGTISGISEHWGPHHGPQSAMLLGLTGAGVAGTPHQHYGITNTCVACHMGQGLNHTFEPVLATSQNQACHPGATSFDINGRQTEIENLTDQLGAALLTANLINENSPDGHPIVSSASENHGIALWNWLYVAHEDQSVGVHNYPYAKALLEDGLARMAAPAPMPAPGVLARTSH